MRAMRTMAPATAPPISGPRWLEDEDGGGLDAGTIVWMITFVVVMTPPLAADVMTEITELRLVVDGCAAPPPALLVVDVDVVWDVEVGVGVVEEDEDEDDDDVVDVVSLDVASPLAGFPIMAAEATAGPLVLIEATEVPLGNGKKSSELLLSQQTFDALRLWSQHQFPL